jgi:hypothetical protein
VFVHLSWDSELDSKNLFSKVVLLNKTALAKTGKTFPTGIIFPGLYAGFIATFAKISVSGRLDFFAILLSLLLHFFFVDGNVITAGF